MIHYIGGRGRSVWERHPANLEQLNQLYERTRAALRNLKAVIDENS